MMSKSNVLCLILSAMLLSACSAGISKAPNIIKNDVPDSLLICENEPEKPSFNTGDNKQDFQNMTTYAAKVKNAGADCRSKLNRTRKLIKLEERPSPLEVSFLEPPLRLKPYGLALSNPCA